MINWLVSFAAGLLMGCVLTVCVAGIIWFLWKTSIGRRRKGRMILKIWMPEDLDFQGVFEPVLDRYASSYSLLLVKTIEFGTLCEIRYLVRPKEGIDQKEFMDEIRKRNGNLNIVMIPSSSYYDQRYSS